MRIRVAAGRGQIRAALGVFALGVLLTGAFAWHVTAQYNDALQARFHERVNAAAEGIKDRIERYQFGLRGARGALVAMGDTGINRQAFARYMTSRDMAAEFPGARGFGFIRRVPEPQLSAYLEAARRDGAPDFEVRLLSPHDGDRYIIEYIYPDATNRGATGLDIASEPNRRSAAVESMLSGEPRLTAPITLVQADQRAQQGFLFLMPLYRGPTSANTPAQRDQHLIGWSYTPLVIDEVLAGMGDRLKELDARLSDEGTGARFYAAHDAAQETTEGLSTSVQLPMFGRMWRLDARSTPAIAAAIGPRRSGETWIAGLALSFLAALSVYQLMQRRRQHRALLGLPDVAHEATLRNFFGSPLARGALSLYLAGLALYAGMGYRGLWEDAERRWEEDLDEVVTARARQVERALASRRRTMEFLAATPTATAPAQGALDRASTFDRIQALATAYLRGAPEIQALDMVWLQRNADAKARSRPDADPLDEAAEPAQRLMREADGRLQRVETPLLGDERDLLQQLLKNAGSTVVYSPLRRQSIGGAAPSVVFKAAVIARDAAERPVAAMVATVDASRRSSDLALPLPAHVSLFAVNDRDELLSPPPADRSASGSAAATQQDVDVFAAPIPVPGRSRLNQVTGPRGDHWTVRHTLAYNADWPAANVTYIASVPLSAVGQSLRHELWHRLQVPLAGGLLGGALLFFYWMGLQRQLLVRAQHLHQAALLDQTHDAFIALDVQGRVLSWNRAAEELFGLRARDALGQPLVSLAPIEATWPTGLAAGQDAQFTTMLLPAEDTASPASPDSPAAAAEGGTDAAPETQAPPEPRWLSIHCLRLATTGPWGADVIVIVRDVSAEREVRLRLEALNDQLEREVQARTQDLAQERQRLYNIIEGTAVGTWEWKIQDGQLLCNDRWASMLGLHPEDLEPMSMARWRELLHPQDLPAFDMALQRHLQRRDPVFSCEIRMRHQQGRWVWIQSLGRVMSWTPDEAPEWMVGIHQDITPIKAALEELASTASLLQGVLRAATEVSIIATDDQGTITVFNSGAERLLGYRAEEVVGRHSPALIHVKEEIDARGKELSREIGRPVSGFSALVRMPQLLGSENREWTYVRKDGSRFPVSLVVTTQRDAEGRLLGYLGIAQDITARREAEQALLQARDNAEAASRAKSSFLANMSHELRTPMNAVLGIAHLLKRSSLNGDQRSLLGKLETAGKTLLAIINDVLDLAKIEAGGLHVEWAAVEPRKVLAEIGELIEAQAAAKGLQIHTDCADDVPTQVASDPLRLRQILLNLVGNAVKFTSSGTVSVTVRCAVTPTGKALAWAVADTGIGISDEARQRLFQPFVQADLSTTRRYGGTGLGLSIVRELTEMLGGSIDVDSRPGQGSTFTLTLPEHEMPAQRPAGDLQILLLGPLAAPQAEIRSLCERMGWSARMAVEPSALHEGAPVDVVIADTRAMGMLQASDEARSLRGVPTIQLNADGQEVDPKDPVAAILRPPVSASRLFNAVAAALAPRRDYERLLRRTRVDEVEVQWLRGLRILVVDDSDINLEIARTLLAREGADVDTAGNGEEALTTLKAGTRPPIDAVLMDVQMPVMDGLQACRILRQELHMTLPVIALSAGALDDERERALEAGMTDFLSKPLDPAAVVRSLRLHIDRAASEDVTDRMADPVADLDSTPDQHEA
ncbi:CHASE domain-containing protein [Roseateles amylovorans]|uniref:histidine kinase n=1 Tax=Roseateles amylovorans TaxID=2978473 RepID=A0ABY6B670_9BURK|nr:CHASE domain-containing protein [Roseateles amylovorans]UXH79823.1 CHASE domain-containing protein [Roseateles amylovorans]